MLTTTLAATAAGTLRLLAVQVDWTTFCTGSVPPSAVKAHQHLMAALEDMLTWEQRHQIAEELLKDIRQSRSDIAGLSKKYGTRCMPGA